MKENKSNFFKMLILMLVLLGGADVYSYELYSNQYSVRAMGMGGAYSPIVKDIDSLFYNPAGLGKTTKFNLTLMKLRLGIDGVDLLSDIKETDSNKIADLLRKFYGKKIWAGGGATSGISVPGFAVAGYDNFNLSADLSNPALPSFQVNLMNDYGGAVGFGLEVAPGVNFGVAAKRIYRLGGTGEISVGSIAGLNGDDIKNELYNKGIGHSLDLGSSFTLPSMGSPTLSFVWKNVGNTKFVAKAGDKAPPVDEDEMIAGLAFDFSTDYIGLTPVFEMRYLNDNKIHLGKKLHFGVELDLSILALRGGFSQGYWTAGAGINLGFLVLDVASYGVELGAYPGQKEDRRYVLELTVDFGYDSSKGTFLGLSPKNRRNLKQRR